MRRLRSSPISQALLAGGLGAALLVRVANADGGWATGLAVHGLWLLAIALAFVMGRAQR